jgi:hypothetical protein
MRNVYRIILEALEVRGHLEDLGIGGQIIIQWILKKLGWIRLAEDRD